METNKKNIPEIRFPEFMNDGEWRLDTIETVFDIRNGYTPSKANPLFWENGTIPWFRMEDIRKSGHILSDAIQHITPKAVKGSGLIPAYSIIVATTATIGEHALTIVDSLANQRFTFLTKCKSFEKRIDMLYFHYFMFIIDEWCKRNTNAGGLLSVNMDSFKRLVVPYPPTIAEQKRIAECFYSLDKVIESTRQKLEQLKAHKKGLMQKLFPAPGKSVPECRFKEFDNDGEWNSSTLKDIADVVQGYGFPERLQGKHVGKYPFIKVGDISYAYNQGDLSIKSASNYIDDKELIELKATAIKAGTTIFAKVGEAIKANKKVITSMECLIDNNVAGIKCKNNHNTDDLFLFYSMTRIDFTEFAGGVVPSIKKTTIEEITISIPNNITEQHRIAHSLSSVDKLINLYSSKLEELEQHKQALRQRLFPTI